MRPNLIVTQQNGDLLAREYEFQLRQAGNFFSRICGLVQNNLKLIALFTIIISFSCLHGIESASKSWASSRRVGFLQAGMCRTAGNLYAVADVNILAPNIFDDTVSSPTKCYVPVCVDISKGSGSNICFSPVGVDQCLDVFTDKRIASRTLTVATLTDSFPSDSRAAQPVILYSTLIIAASTIAFVLTLAFESTLLEALDNDPGRFVTGRNKVMMIRLNTALTILLVALLVSSSQNFMLIRQLDCASTYAKESRDDPFCMMLASCNGGVASIISPPQNIVKNYRELALGLCIFLIITSFAQNARRVNNGNQYHSRNHRRVAVVDEGDVRIVEALIRSLSDSRGTGSRAIGTGSTVQRNVPLDFFDNMNTIHKRNLMIAKWKPCPVSEVADCSCSICLEPLASTALDHSEDKSADLLPCGHKFHRACIVEWALRQNSCPECRKQLLP